MSTYSEQLAMIERDPRSWLVTGVAGFIGSHLAENLLRRGQRVVGLDNFSTGRRDNLPRLRQAVGEAAWANFRFIEGDIRSLETCREACKGMDYVLQQAALGSVVRSIEDPIISHDNNVTGFLNMLVAARDAGVKRMVYASSSAAYGDHPELPKVEARIGNLLSTYGLTKYVNELYMQVFATCYGFESIGLRYFNVFGPRQDPYSTYAAVIPAWISALIAGEPVYINGDGTTSRDFCHIDNVVQANLLCALSGNPEAVNQAYNVAVGEQTSLNELFARIRSLLAPTFPHVASVEPVYRDFRVGDVKYSLADISKARERLGYVPTYRIGDGLEQAIAWYVANVPALAPPIPAKAA